MTALITLSDIQQLKPISSNINSEKKVVPFIIEAQQFDLKEMLGSSFYLAISNDVLADDSLTTYADLWNGSEWTFQTKTYKHEGLKSVLAYLSYYRYVMNAGQEETAFGIVAKREDNSTTVSEKTIQRKTDEAKSQAYSLFDDVRKFLDDNYTDYPLWGYDCDQVSKRSSVTAIEPNDSRIAKVSRKNYYNSRYL